MITAVDTSVLLDVLTNDPVNGTPSLSALRAAAAIGQLVVSVMEHSFAEAHIAFDSFDRAYRRRGGSRTRLIADFFIGAHAQRRGDRLVTRDRGFYRRYFTDLQIIDGSE